MYATKLLYLVKRKSVYGKYPSFPSLVTPKLFLLLIYATKFIHMLFLILEIELNKDIKKETFTVVFLCNPE